LPEVMEGLIAAMPIAGHPMPILASLVSVMATLEPDPTDDEQERRGTLRLIARLPALAASIHRHIQGEPAVESDGELDYAENFLNMMFGTAGKASSVDPEVAKALDLLLVLHADHEQNCSTSAVRLVGSSLAHPYAAISAGISALWGPLHGGANQAVIEMLEEIAEGGGTARDFLERAKSKQDTTRLMGFGHRVYKSYDPRAKILKGACDGVLAKLGSNSKLLDIACELEQITLEDEYFISRSLYPNVDFYSGVIYRALGIPTEMFTVMFAIGRLPGWLAQGREMRASSEFRIGRPRQLYTGKTQRPV
jgi:citrate synthase